MARVRRKTRRLWPNRFNRPTGLNPPLYEPSRRNPKRKLFVGYDEISEKQYAIINHALDAGQMERPALEQKTLVKARLQLIPEYAVLYRKGRFSNPICPEYNDMDRFRVKRIWPEPETEWITLTPNQWVDHLVSLRTWVERGQQQPLPPFPPECCD
jgi:hypothetical protein